PLPPTSYADERAKVEERLPAVQRFIRERGINEQQPGSGQNFGIILQGGTYGVAMRALTRLGLSDGYGNSHVPLLVLNVIHPLVPEEITQFLDGKDSIFVIEEGHPALIESQVRDFAQQAGLTCRVQGKDLIPTTGEYVANVVRAGLAAFVDAAAPESLRKRAAQRNGAIEASVALARSKAAAKPLPPRPPGFCTGCPERPIFTALKLITRERGPLHLSLDIGCSTFASFAPFNLGNTVVGYGLSLASGGPIGAAFDQPTVAVMGDGAFWHNGLTTGAVNAQWQGMDAVLVVLENGYASATGQQHVPSTGATPLGTPAQVSIEKALRGIGVTWIRRVDSYSLDQTVSALRDAIVQRGRGLRVVISDNECMLARKRREKRADARSGGSSRRARYGVDAEVCSGDHSCIRLNGCPSLTLKPTQDPLKDGPTAYVDNGCAACNLCGEVAQAAQLCPSFYKAEDLSGSSGLRRLNARVHARLLSLLGAS
ncbi:MAG: thiamine pyrophosphate-dependent enzyme, partial [Gammaproteobacteria bacterium]